MAYPNSHEANRIDEVMSMGRSEIRAELEFCYMRLKSNESELLNAVRSSSANASKLELAEEGRCGEKRCRRIAEKQLKEAIETRDNALEERDKARNKLYSTLSELCTIKREMATKKKKSNENLVSVITKLARDRSVGKRLAAACHPDRVPAELNDSSTELFRFFQTIRETDG